MGYGHLGRKKSNVHLADGEDALREDKGVGGGELLLDLGPAFPPAGLHQKVILIDGRRLAELIIEHNIGVAEEYAYRIKKIDSDYFEEA